MHNIVFKFCCVCLRESCIISISFSHSPSSSSLFLLPLLPCICLFSSKDEDTDHLHLSFIVKVFPGYSLHKFNPQCSIAIACSFPCDILLPSHVHIGLRRWLSVKESAYQCRRHGFDPWVGKIPWSSKWQSTPVFLPGKSQGQRNLASYSP